MWGRIDVLVNNAGGITYDTPVWATTMEQWDEVMNTNLRGMHLVCRAVIPHMMQRKRGVIVNIGSSSGRRPDSEYGAYATSKWGVVGYTASLAHSLRNYGIRVNGINPDWVDTDMARAYNPSGDPDWIAPRPSLTTFAFGLIPGMTGRGGATFLRCIRSDFPHSVLAFRAARLYAGVDFRVLLSIAIVPSDGFS